MRRTCALTGHRELEEGFDKNALYYDLEHMIEKGCDRFLCGMAVGFDLLALQCLVDLREKYPVTLVACVPYRGQEAKFGRQEKKLYATLLDACDEIAVLHEHYVRGCFLERDRYMVDRADVLFAYCVKKEGGAAYTVRYAQRNGVDVVLFPSSQKTENGMQIS